MQFSNLFFFSKKIILISKLNRAGTGYKLKETSNLGPRPEKPIEIYEFEGYSKLYIFMLDTLKYK